MEQYNYGWLADSRAGLASAADSSKAVIDTKGDLSADWIGNSTHQILKGANLMAEPSRGQALQDNIMKIQGEKQSLLDIEKDNFARKILFEDAKQDMKDMSSYDTMGMSYDDAVANITDRVRQKGFSNPEHALAALSAPNANNNQLVMELRKESQLVGDLMALQEINKKQDRIDAGNLDTKDIMTLAEAMRSRSPHAFQLGGAESYVKDKLGIMNTTMSDVKDAYENSMLINQNNNPMYDDIPDSTDRRQSNIMGTPVPRSSNIMDISMSNTTSSKTTIPNATNNIAEAVPVDLSDKDIQKKWGVKNPISMPSFSPSFTAFPRDPNKPSYDEQDGYQSGIFMQGTFDDIIINPNTQPFEKQVQLLDAVSGDRSLMSITPELAPMKEKFQEIIGNNPDNFTPENISKVMKESGLPKEVTEHMSNQLNQLGAYFDYMNQMGTRQQNEIIKKGMQGEPWNSEQMLGNQDKADVFNQTYHNMLEEASKDIGAIRPDAAPMIEAAVMAVDALGANQDKEALLKKISIAINKYIPNGGMNSGQGLHSNINDLVQDVMEYTKLDKIGSLQNPNSTDKKTAHLNNTKFIRNIVLAGLINGSLDKKGNYSPSSLAYAGRDNKAASLNMKNYQRVWTVLTYGDAALNSDPLGHYLLNNK